MNNIKKIQTKFSKAVGFKKGNQKNSEQSLQNSCAEQPKVFIEDSPSSAENKDYALLPFNFISLVKPGFYEICYLKTGKRYIGETQNLLERLGKHVATLQTQTHDCLSLQADWTSEKKENNLANAFSISVFAHEDQNNVVMDKKKQKAQESMYLSRFDPETLYNTPLSSSSSSNKQENYRRAVHIKGVDYETVAAAASTLGVGETTIRRWVNHPDKTDCFTKEKKKHGYSECVVDGVNYPSVKSLVDQNIAPSLLFATRRLKSSNFPDWYYLDEQKRAKAYSERKKHSVAKPCRVDGIDYPSIKSLETAGIASGRNYALFRLKSPDFPNWQYI